MIHSDSLVSNKLLMDSSMLNRIIPSVRHRVMCIGVAFFQMWRFVTLHLLQKFSANAHEHMKELQSLIVVIDFCEEFNLIYFSVLYFKDSITFFLI